MENHLQKLKDAFHASSFDQNDLNNENYTRVFQELSSLIGEAIPEVLKPMEWVAERTYETDNVGVLCLIFCDNLIDSDIDYFESDFEEGDWFEDNEEHEMMENEYGEEGTQYYLVYTKTQVHTFSEDRPFSNGVDYVKSETQS
jgi:hypothetical protein